MSEELTDVEVGAMWKERIALTKEQLDIQKHLDDYGNLLQEVVGFIHQEHSLDDVTDGGNPLDKSGKNVFFQGRPVSNLLDVVTVIKRRFAIRMRLEKIDNFFKANDLDVNELLRKSRYFKATS